MNALQMNDMLTGGLMSGIAAVQQRNAERAEVAQHNNMVDVVDEWKGYAANLQKVIDAQEIKISELTLDHARLTVVKDNLTIDTRCDKHLIKSYLGKIQKLGESMVRQSADAFSLEKMRDRLIEELTEIATSPTPLMDPEARLALHHADWDEFMETSVPPTMKHVKSNRFP